ncbi:MAG TPA: hypothetical protein VEL82_07075 [Thermoplasmata archaeon]|nr:hypothetical protein [Thermoplasmata archaeon]
MPDHYTQLLEWRRTEAAVRGLAKLPHDFYRTTSAYLAEVRAAYEGELRENPSGRKGEMSRQTYQRASQIARDIIEARSQKVLTAAFQASIGGTRDLPNALAEERVVFDSVLAALTQHRRDSAPYLEADSARVPPAPATRPPEPVHASEAPPAARAARAPGPLTYVRILEGGRQVALGAENLELRTDDVLSLPAEQARLLVETKVAERIDAGPELPVT